LVLYWYEWANGSFCFCTNMNGNNDIFDYLVHWYVGVYLHTLLFLALKQIELMICLIFTLLRWRLTTAFVVTCTDMLGLMTFRLFLTLIWWEIMTTLFFLLLVQWELTTNLILSYPNMKETNNNFGCFLLWYERE